MELAMSTRDKDIQMLLRIKASAGEAYDQYMRNYKSGKGASNFRYAGESRAKANDAGLAFAQAVIALDVLGYQPNEPDGPSEIKGPKTDGLKF